MSKEEFTIKPGDVGSVESLGLGATLTAREGVSAKVTKAEVTKVDDAHAVLAHRQALSRAEGKAIPVLICVNCGAILKDRDGVRSDGKVAEDCCKTSAVLIDARTVTYNKEYTKADGTVVPAGTEIDGAVHLVDKEAEIAQLQARIDELKG